MFKISVDADACIGCAACTGVCDNFVMEDGKAIPVKSKVEEITCNQDAEGMCPVQAIKVEEV